MLLHSDSHQELQALFPSPLAAMLSLDGPAQDMEMTTVSMETEVTHTAGPTGEVMMLLTQADQFPAIGLIGW